MNKRRFLIVLVAILLISLVVLPEPSNTAIAQQRYCPDATPAFLSIGTRVSVVDVPSGRTMVSKVLRASPDQASKTVFQLKPWEASFNVIEGPVCKNGYTWWKVKSDYYNDNTIGWLAEGDADGFYVYSYSQRQATQQAANLPTPTLSTVQIDKPKFEQFAAFNPGEINVTGKLQPYTVKPDFSNVVISEVLSQEQMDYLRRNGFVVSPGSALEFYSVYESFRYDYQPLFITTDSMLHSFHVVFDKTLRTAEELYFAPLLRDLNRSLLTQTDKLYQTLKGTDWETAARRTVAYTAVALRLSDPNSRVPDYVKDVVDKDLQSIQAATNGSGGMAASAVFPDRPNGEDWSQYKPRGHYTQNAQLSAYFQAMMWYGRMNFRLENAEETKSAVLLALAVRDANVAGSHGIDAWADLYEPTVFFVGVSDSLTIPQYIQTLNQVYGAKADAVAIHAKGIEPFQTAANKLVQPGMLAADSTSSIDAQAKGLRFMGQRFTLDGYILRQLVYANVGTAAKPRMLPSALDVFAAMGSDRALQILDKAGATDYENYRAQMDKVRANLGKMGEADWTDSLYGAWLYTLGTFGKPTPNGYPSFMTNTAYQDRSLYAALGSYAELKHDTALYASQSYAEGGGGGGKGPAPEPVAPPNYVEPVPLFWARLAALAEMTSDGLSKRRLLNTIDQNTLKRISDMARRFQAYSIKELNGQLLTSDEQNFLRFYGESLKRIQQATADNPEPIPPYRSGGYMGDTEPPQIAVAADIATGGDKVRQLAVGRAFHIYTVVPVGDKLYLAQGAVFSYYEFDQPLANRLTDEDWRKMLNDGKAPALPAWTASFISTKTINEALVSGVRQFQRQLVDWLWWDPVKDYQDGGSTKDPIPAFVNSQLKPLAEKKQYEGRQIIEVDFRSFDLKDAETAIVTTRETWQGTLYGYGKTARDPGPKVAVRGPYVIDMTYTLKKIKAKETWDIDYWEVTNAVMNSQPPDWEKVAP